MHKPTHTEKEAIRALFYSGRIATICIGENADGTYFLDCEVAIIEADSPSNVLLELVQVLRES